MRVYYGSTADGASGTSGVLIVDEVTTYTSTGTGSWNTAGTWSPSGPPTAGSNVIIRDVDTVTVDGSTNNIAGLTVNGTLDTSTNTAVAGTGTGTLTVASTGTINVGANNFPTGFTIGVNGLDPNSTVNYYRNDGTAQTVAAVSTNYGHLTLSGSGTKTMPGSTQTVSGNLTLSGTATATTAAQLTVSGNLSVGDGTTFTSAGYALTVTGTTTVGGGTSGTLAISSATGTKTFTGLVTINAGGAWTNTANSAVTYGGSLTNNGTFNTGTVTQTFSGNSANLTNAGTFNGSGSSVTMSGTTQIITCDGLHTITVGTLTPTAVTNNCLGGLTVSTSLTGTGTLTQGANSVLNIGNISDITTLTATASGNTVNYSGAAQTIKSTAYSNLTLSGSGTKTLGGSVSVAGNWTNSSNLTLSGNYTVTFNGAANQAIYGSTAWYGLAVTGVTRIVSFENAKTQAVSNSLSFVADAGNLLTLAPVSGGSSWLLTFTGSTQSVSRVSVSWSNAGGGTAINATDGTNTDGGNCVNWIFTSGTYTSNGTGNWNTPGSWTPSGPPMTYSNVVIAGGHVITVDTTPPSLKNVTVNGSLNAVGYTLSGLETFSVTSGGTLLVGGTSNFPAFATTTLNANSTVSYNNAGAQTVSPQTYGHLILTGSGAKTLTSVSTINGDLTLSGTATAATAAALTVSGNLSVGSGTTLATGATNTWTLSIGGTTSVTGTLTLANTGSKTFTGDVTINSGGNWNETGAAPISFAGSLANSQTFTANTGTHTFTGVTKTLSGTISIPTATFSGTGTAYTNSGTFTSLTLLTVASPAVLTNNGTITATTALSGGGTLTQGANAVLYIGGTSGITTLTATASGNTVNYSGSGTQTVNPTTYYNLTLSGSGAKMLTSVSTINGDLTLSGTATATTAAALTVSGNLSVGSGTTLATGATNTWTLSIGGTTSVTGTLTLANTGSKTFTGDVTINSGGNWNETGAAPISFAGSLANSQTFTASTGTHTFTGVTKTLSGTISIPTATFSGTGTAYTNSGTFTSGTLLTVTSPAVLTNNGTITATTALSGDGTLTQGANAVLNIGGTSGITTLTATASGNTVNYTRSGTQTVNPTTYYNLTLSGSGAKTLTSVSTINGGLTLSGTATASAATAMTIGGTVTLGAGTTFTGGAYTHNVAGDWTNNGGLFTSTGTTINFNSTSVAQAINGTATGQTFNSITVNKSGQTLSVGGSTTTLTVNGTVTLTAGVFNAGTANITVFGDWLNNIGSGSAFAHNSKTVTFNGNTQTITGDNIWYGLSIIGNSRTVSIESGKTQTIAAGGSLTLSASSGNILTLQRTSSDPWKLNYGGASMTVQNVSVSFSDASSGGTIFAATSTDGGSNSNWEFGNACTSGVTSWRSRGSGNWATAGSWSCNTGSSWNYSTSGIPNGITNIPITIRNGHTITVAVAATANTITIDAGGKVIVSSGVTWTISNGTANPDLSVSGTITNAGTITPTGTIAFNSGGLYEHNFTTTAGVIPSATWNTGSTMAVIGYTTFQGLANAAGGTTDGNMAGFNQTFYNVIWNCPNQVAGNLVTVNGNQYVQSIGLGAATFTTNINGNFTIESTGAGKVDVRLYGQAGYPIINIYGDLIVHGGRLDVCGAGTNGNYSTLNIYGNFIQDGGDVLTSTIMTGTDGSNYSRGQLNMKGAGKTFTQSAGTFNGVNTISGLTYTSRISINVQNGASVTMNNNIPTSKDSLIAATSFGVTVELGGVLNTYGNSTVNTITGAGYFNLNDGGTLGISSAAGITTSGATGNVQSTTRTYGTGATYNYNNPTGSTAQVTGNGLPSASGVTLKSNNSAGVTLSAATTVGTLTIGDQTSNSLFIDGGYQLSSAGTLNLTSGTFKLGTAGTATTFPSFATNNIATGTTVEYASGQSQTIAYAPTYSNLTSSGGGLKTLDGSSTVNGILNFTNGSIKTGGTYTYTLSLGSSATCTGASTSAGYVDGNLKKSYPATGSFTFCVGQNGYSPADVNITASPADFTVRAVNTRDNSIPAYSGGTGPSALSRYWSLTNTSSTADLAFHYLDGDVTEGNESDLVKIVRDEGGTLTVFDSTNGATFNTTTNTATIPNISAFSLWTLAGASASGNPTAVKLISFDAVAYDDGVRVQWRTGHEIRNLGFNLYRKNGGQLERINGEIIAGSALVAGHKVEVKAGRPYSWLDDAGTGNTSYYLEDIDMSGKRTLYGPVTPGSAHGQQAPAVAQSTTLNGLSAGHSAVKDKRAKLQHRMARASAAGIASAAVTVSSFLTPEQMQTIVAGVSAVKLFVQEEGWYRISQPELAAAGLLTIDPRFLQLYVNGVQIPMIVSGESDRRFDSGDYIEFYGKGADTPATDTQTYYLLGGITKGLRIKNTAGGAAVAEPTEFMTTEEARPREIYAAGMPRNVEGDRFFGPIIFPEPSAPTAVTLKLHNVDSSASSPARIDVDLQGIFDGSHNVDVILNGTTLGQVVFSNMEKGHASLSFDQSGLLADGDNTVQLIGKGGDMDFSLLDRVLLSYWHTYTADSDTLRFTALGGGTLTVRGFTSPDVRIMDITDPLSPWEVVRTVATDGPSFSATFGVPSTGSRTLLAFASGGIQHPAGITYNKASSLRSRLNRADVVVIAHSSLIPAVEPLKQFRESQGRTVAVVDIEDIYDEFSFGNKSPQAIQDFLKTASTWLKKPRFVLFAGDASVDPRDYLGYGQFDLVPTYLVDGFYSEAPSDDAFADFNADGIPEMAVGRIPAADASQLAAVITKIIGYETAPVAPWTGKAILASDIGTSDVFFFEDGSDEIGAMLTPYMTSIKKVYRRDYSGDALASADLLANINGGASIVNYLGHGSEDTWGGNLLVSSDAAGLTNGLKLPFFLNMTCWNGQFASPYVVSLGESLLKSATGGAIAVWASSGLSDPAPQHDMNKRMITILTNGTRPTLGEAAAQAKTATTDMDVRRTWILLGDPLTRLK